VVLDHDSLGFETIAGDRVTENELLRLVAERIRVAADHLQLTREDLRRIFSRHSIFEGETHRASNGKAGGFILVETHHLIQGKVGKGALKLVFPPELLGKGTQFAEAGPGVVEVMPPPGQPRWIDAGQADKVVKQAMREFMTGESLSMSLKCQATDAPFGGSEGLLLCAVRQFEETTGRYFIKPALSDGDEPSREDKELIELMMNEAAEMLTRAGRIAYDKIVHAAETNSTLTARLDLELSSNVVEGHLRTLLQENPDMVIGDDDMTARLRELLGGKDYAPSACTLAKAAARMQMEHSVLLSGSREKLRAALARLPAQGSPTPAQYREIVDLFFGTGEIQQNEDQLYHHREPILRVLSVALSTRSLDDCGEPEVLAMYLKTLLDNQRIMMEAALLRRLPRGQALAMDWFDRAPLLSSAQERRLAALMPASGITRDKVKENFWEIVNILCEAKADIPRDTTDPYMQARKEVLERATRAITSAADLLPCVDRIVFFTLPFTYECVTPKLGVVTRKPVKVCGSELRPEAMALGGVMASEILLKKLTRKAHPLRDMTVAIEGLGNAGKHVATFMMQKGATIVGVSDSKGALVAPGGFTREELAVIITHKSSGKRLDTLLSSAAARGLSEREGESLTFFPQPEKLKQMKADILVLAAIPASVDRHNAAQLQVNVVAELAGGAVTGHAKKLLSQRQIHVVPDNLASSGGLLVSLSEMLQNSAGQNWDRKLEEYNLYDRLSKSYEAVLRTAKEFEVDAPTASDILALRRMHELASYREQLESLARRLEERIKAVQPDERILIASDNDEDGVASAAILCNLIARLNPGAETRLDFLNESFRSNAILDFIAETDQTGAPVRHVFVLDRCFPLDPPGQTRLAQVTRRCQVTFVNNHKCPVQLLESTPLEKRPPGLGSLKTPCELGILFISPQTLKATLPAKEFSTSMILKEVAQQLLTDEPSLIQINWQAAVGSCLDASAEPSSEWLWFFSQFNPDRTREAARALRMVTRASGFLNSVHALLGVTRPDQLETHQAWGQFLAQYRTLDERVQVLVEKIILENRRRPFTSHFFTHEEIASPTPLAGSQANELDFYHWISEHLTTRGDLGGKPIIVGQVVHDTKANRSLGVRIRSPRGVELMEVGLPECFKTGGLPNTAIARIPLELSSQPEDQFHQLVDEIWRKTTSPLYLGSGGSGGDRLGRPSPG
jgi:glutamate dehydrogenase/leucine dehydrogenase